MARENRESAWGREGSRSSFCAPHAEALALQKVGDSLTEFFASRIDHARRNFLAADFNQEVRHICVVRKSSSLAISVLRVTSFNCHPEPSFGRRISRDAWDL